MGELLLERASKREESAGQRKLRDFIPTVMKDDFGRPIDFETVHKVMLHHIQWCYENGIWCALYGPWEHSKTTLSMGFVLWQIAEKGMLGYKAKVVSAGADTASKRLCAIRDYIDKDPDFKRVYPHITRGDKWTDHKINIRKPVITVDKTLESHGLDSKDMGSRPDIIWFDDVCDAKNTLTSALMRENTTMTYENSWISRVKTAAKEDKYNTFVLNTSNVWHEKDLTQEIKTKSGYCILEVKANATLTRLECEVLNATEDYHPPEASDVRWEGKVLKFNIPFWSRIDRPVLVSKKGTMRLSTFNRGYLLIPTSGEEKDFPSYDMCVEYDVPLTKQLLDSLLVCVFGVDLSGNKRKGTSITVIGWDGKHRLRLHVKTGAWTSPDTAKKLKRLYDIFNPTVIGVENNAYQKALIEWIKAMGEAGLPGYEFWAKVKGLHTGNNKIDEEKGLPGLETQFSNRGYRIINPHGKHDHGLNCQKGSKKEPCDYCRERVEFATFPHSTADTVMSFWLADRLLRTKRGTSGTGSWDKDKGDGDDSRRSARDSMRADRDTIRPGRDGKKRFF